MSSRFFTCSVPRCERASVRATGGCEACSGHFCFVHIAPAFHQCSLKAVDDATYALQITTEINRLLGRINDEAVCKHASSLNGGRSCTIEHLSAVGLGALMGSANYHCRIRFHDGSSSWLFRVPRVASFAVGLPPSLVEYLVLSEYATLKFLETTAVPAPRVFSYGICGDGTDHGTGVSFILMEELPGTPWTGQGVSTAEASEIEKSKVWSGLADILTELDRHAFPVAGSLILSGQSELEISAVASDRFLVLTPSGPFASSTAYYTAFAEQYLDLIADGQLYTEYPIDAYLVYQFLKDNVAQLVSHGEGISPDEDESQMKEKFYLKHVDDKGDHLLVDEQLNITGIIDWQMARIVPRREAFGPSLVTADMNSLCNGKLSLSPNDRALADLLSTRLSNTNSYMSDEKARRFFWGLALEPEWKYALPLANAVLEAFGVIEDWSQWRETALEKYKYDGRLHRVVERMNGYEV